MNTDLKEETREEVKQTELLDELFMEGEAMDKDQRNSKRGGYYWIDGEPYPSVTAVLTVIDKPALRHWYGREIWRAMVGNPTLSEKSALAIPYEANESAKNRGSTIHSLVEAYKHTKEHVASIPEEFRGYAQAFYRWTEDNHVTVLEHERTVISRKHHYAGTLDMLVKLNGNEKPIVVDVKTGKDIYLEAFLQLSAYKQALKEEGTEVEATAVLLLQEDGSYKYQYSTQDCFRQFFACKVLWEWLNAEEFTRVRQYAKGGKRGQD